MELAAGQHVLQVEASSGRGDLDHEDAHRTAAGRLDEGPVRVAHVGVLGLEPVQPHRLVGPGRIGLVRLGIGDERKDEPGDEHRVELGCVGHVFRDVVAQKEVLPVRHPQLPTLCKTDGDVIEWTTLKYDLGLSVQDAFALLKPLATVGGEEYMDDVVLDASGAVTGARLTWTKAGNKQHKDWTNTSLGAIDLTPGHLQAEVNSRRRADRLAREITRRLGLGATLVERTVTDVQAALAERQEQRAAGTLMEPDLEPAADADRGAARASRPSASVTIVYFLPIGVS